VTFREGGQLLFTPKLERAAVELVVVTEAGATVYVDNVERGTVPADGLLRVPDVTPGKREVKITKPGFLDGVVVGEYHVGAPVRVEVSLAPEPSSKAISEDFEIGLGKWSRPASGFAADNGELVVGNCPVPGLLKANYRDFTLHFELALRDGKGAAWVLRAKDPRNYYLFYLSGPRGRYPNRFVTFEVRDGVVDVDNPLSSPSLPTVLAPNGYYSIDVDVRGSTVTTTITAEDAKSGEVGRRKNLDALTIERSSYPIGSVGFRTFADETFAVDNFFVLPK
jgi:hypothetical protein